MPPPHRLQETLVQLTNKLESMDAQLQSIVAMPPQSTVPESEAPTQESTEEGNKAYLSTLSIEQVSLVGACEGAFVCVAL